MQIWKIQHMMIAKVILKFHKILIYIKNDIIKGVAKSIVSRADSLSHTNHQSTFLYNRIMKYNV